MFSLYTYHHLPKIQRYGLYMYVFYKLNPSCFPCFSGAQDYITLFLDVQSAPPVAPCDSPEVLPQPTSDDGLSAYGRQLHDTEHTVMSSNILKFATTMRENFDDLQILSSPSKRKPEIIENIEFISKCSVLRTLTQKQSIRFSGRVGATPGEVCIACRRGKRDSETLSKLT